MAKAVFTTKAQPTYDDLPEERYHFPRTYLNQVRQAEGDFIVYYEPRRESAELSGRAGRQSYVATARVAAIRPDAQWPGRFYADMSDYAEFLNPVPFREAHGFYERNLRKPDGRTNRGAFGRAVRLLEEDEFRAIVAAGLATGPDRPWIAEELGPMRDLAAGPTPDGRGLGEDPAEFERPTRPQILNRKVRDVAFREAVRKAYAYTCAVTGLAIRNGQGRPEIEAAHIRPVEANGPDSPRNGIALCRTAHWMFDRGLLGIADDGRFLVAASKVPEDARRLLRPDGRLVLPADPAMRPHPQFARWHREHQFKGI